MNTVVIAVNLGHFKAFRVVGTPVRGRKLEPIDEVSFPEAHGHFQDKVTDKAGRFASSIRGEALHAARENARRLVQLVAGRTADVLQAERPKMWILAAPHAVHRAICNALPSPPSRHVFADLTKTRPREVLAHVRSP